MTSEGPASYLEAWEGIADEITIANFPLIARPPINGTYTYNVASLDPNAEDGLLLQRFVEAIRGRPGIIAATFHLGGVVSAAGYPLPDSVAIEQGLIGVEMAYSHWSANSHPIPKEKCLQLVETIVTLLKAKRALPSDAPVTVHQWTPIKCPNNAGHFRPPYTVYFRTVPAVAAHLAAGSAIALNKEFFQARLPTLQRDVPPSYCLVQKGNFILKQERAVKEALNNLFFKSEPMVRLVYRPQRWHNMERQEPQEKTLIGIRIIVMASKEAAETVLKAPGLTRTAIQSGVIERLLLRKEQRQTGARSQL